LEQQSNGKHFFYFRSRVRKEVNDRGKREVEGRQLKGEERKFEGWSQLEKWRLEFRIKENNV
jgi:hypothetical protein